MSSMAKIFVVVNLVLGVAAFGAAATLLGAQNDYRAALEEQVAKHHEFKAESAREIAALEQERSTQRDQAVEAVSNASASQQAAESVRAQLAEAKNANERLTKATETASNELRRLTDTIEKEKEFRDRLASKSEEATQAMVNAQQALEDANANRARLEQTVADLNEQIQTLSAQKGDLEKELRNARFWIDEYKKITGQDITGEAMGADGRVIAVRGSLVVVSVGRSDKVRIGDTYNLRRGATFVGQIKITRVEEDSAVGEFDTQFPGPGGSPQVGDIAYTGRGG